MKQKISVIIAAYDEEKHLSHCIKSLQNQTLEPDEIIIVDDGSTDKTWNILLQLQQQYTTLKIYRKQHVEQATARNFGFARSSGDILIFPDADYWFDRRFIEKIISPFKKKHTIATITIEEYIANSDNVWSRSWDVNRHLSPGQRLVKEIPERISNFRAIRRKYFLKSGGYDETGYSSDLSVLTKLGLPRGTLRAKGAICYHYNPDSLGRVFRSARRMGGKRGIEFNLKNLVIYSFPNSLRKGLFKLILGKPEFIFFKVVFDFGVTVGFMERFFETYIKEIYTHRK